MNNKYPHGMGPFGRWIVFWGVSMFFLALATVNHDLLTHAFGSRLDSYVLLGIAVILWMVSSVLIDRIPSHWVIRIGIIGWILTFALLGWYYLFGPGAFGASVVFLEYRQL
jgi:hypothetical protein